MPASPEQIRATRLPPDAKFKAFNTRSFSAPILKECFCAVKERSAIKSKYLEYPTILLLLGGSNKRYNLSYTDYCIFLLKLKNAVEEISGNLIISTSRRTPEKVGIKPVGQLAQHQIVCAGASGPKERDSSLWTMRRRNAVF